MMGRLFRRFECAKSIEISPLPPAFTHTDEIPQGLQLIANAAGHTLLLNGQKPVQKRVLVASIFRLIVGYLFCQVYLSTLLRMMMY